MKNILLGFLAVSILSSCGSSSSGTSIPQSVIDSQFNSLPKTSKILSATCTTPNSLVPIASLPTWSSLSQSKFVQRVSLSEIVIGTDYFSQAGCVGSVVTKSERYIIASSVANATDATFEDLTLVLETVQLKSNDSLVVEKLNSTSSYGYANWQVSTDYNVTCTSSSAQSPKEKCFLAPLTQSIKVVKAPNVLSLGATPLTAGTYNF